METNQPIHLYTPENLLQIMLTKSQLIQKYEYFAKQAKKDGFEQISSIFLETLTQQTNHVKTLFRLLEGAAVSSSLNLFIPKIGSTAENLLDAIQSEKQIIGLIENAMPVAWNEEQKKAHTKIKLFLQISQFYQNRFEKLHQNIETDMVFKKDEKVKWICRKCGLIYESERALHNCPGCEHPQAYFEILSENY
jgi:rubrerythrin